MMKKNCLNCVHATLNSSELPCRNCLRGEAWQPKPTTSEPQCRTKAELHRRWADVLDMCEKAGISSSGFYRYEGESGFNEPMFNSETHKYEFPIAIVEGRPVFRGDVLYNCIGEQCISTEARLSHAGLTWTPPKPATISVNGVEVKRPHKGIAPNFYVFNDVWWVQVPYEDKADAEAFKKAIEGGK